MFCKQEEDAHMYFQKWPCRHFILFRQSHCECAVIRLRESKARDENWIDRHQGSHSCSLEKSVHMKRVGGLAERIQHQDFKTNANIFLAKERRKTGGSLVEMLIQARKPDTCIFITCRVLNLFFFPLVSKGGEVMERNLILTIN